MSEDYHLRQSAEKLLLQKLSGKTKRCLENIAACGTFDKFSFAVQNDMEEVFVYTLSSTANRTHKIAKLDVKSHCISVLPDIVALNKVSSIYVDFLHLHKSELPDGVRQFGKALMRLKKNTSCGGMLSSVQFAMNEKFIEEKNEHKKRMLVRLENDAQRATKKAKKGLWCPYTTDEMQNEYRMKAVQARERLEKARQELFNE